MFNHLLMKNDIFRRSLKKGMMFSFLSAMALGGLWFGGCNVRNSDPVSPNSAVQTQTPIISTETPTATATPTSTVTFIPTVPPIGKAPVRLRA
jgi:hypothetical protein